MLGRLFGWLLDAYWLFIGGALIFFGILRWADGVGDSLLTIGVGILFLFPYIVRVVRRRWG